MIPIFMDFEIEKQIKVEELNLPVDAKKSIDDIKNFIYQRVKILEDEATKHQTDGYISVRLNPPRIEYHYTGDLGKKMHECISESDYRYCMDKIAAYFISLN